MQGSDVGGKSQQAATAKHDQAKNIKKIGSKPESVQVGLMNAPRSAAYGRVCCCLWLVGVD
jgi:hypothetical protein